jgi:hypothetical protein
MEARDQDTKLRLELELPGGTLLNLRVGQDVKLHKIKRIVEKVRKLLCPVRFLANLSSLVDRVKSLITTAWCWFAVVVVVVEQRTGLTPNQQSFYYGHRALAGDYPLAHYNLVYATLAEAAPSDVLALCRTHTAACLCTQRG